MIGQGKGALIILVSNRSTDRSLRSNMFEVKSSDEIFKGCDSHFEIKCSNIKSCYKWHNYLALNNMY